MHKFHNEKEMKMDENHKVLTLVNVWKIETLPNTTGEDHVTLVYVRPDSYAPSEELKQEFAKLIGGKVVFLT